MRRPMTAWLLVIAACEAHISGNAITPGGGQDAATAEDAASAVDAAAVDAAGLGPWPAPAAVAVAATTADEDDVTLSSTALEMIFAIAATNGKDLYYTSRAAVGAAWLTPAKLPFDRDAASEETPRFSGDDKTLYFASDRGASGSLDIYAVTRTTVGSNTTWDAPKLFGDFNTGEVEKWYSPCAGDRYVMVQSNADTGDDLVEGTLGGTPTKIDRVNSASGETGAFVTQDCLTLYFSSTRVTPRRIYVSRREAIGQAWSTPALIDDVKTATGTQEDPWVSPDGRTFALASNAAGTVDIYLSTR